MGYYQIWDCVSGYCEKCLPWSVAILACDMLVHIQRQWGFTYFSRTALVDILLSCIVIMGISRWMDKKSMSMLDEVGRRSFTVYLLHQFIVGFIVKITIPFNNGLVTLLRPFMTIGIIMVGTQCLIFMKKKCNGNFIGGCMFLIGMSNM